MLRVLRMEGLCHELDAAYVRFSNSNQCALFVTFQERGIGLHAAAARVNRPESVIELARKFSAQVESLACFWSKHLRLHMQALDQNTRRTRSNPPTPVHPPHDRYSAFVSLCPFTVYNGHPQRQLRCWA